MLSKTVEPNNYDIRERRKQRRPVSVAKEYLPVVWATHLAVRLQRLYFSERIALVGARRRSMLPSRPAVSHTAAPPHQSDPWRQPEKAYIQCHRVNGTVMCRICAIVHCVRSVYTQDDGPFLQRSVGRGRALPTR